jgi:hypothetical protein
MKKNGLNNLSREKTEDILDEFLESDGDEVDICS